MNYTRLINIYAHQKNALGMSESYIAERAALSQPTVHRIFTGRHNKAAWNDLIAIGKVLGIELDESGLHVRAPEEMLKQQAELVAQTMTRITQSTSQLEGQGLKEREQKKLQDENILWLLTGPRRKLWMEE